MYIKSLFFVSFAILFTVGCGNPVANCDEDVYTTDCCTKDSQCLDVYGFLFPKCLIESGEKEGMCSECITNADCFDENYCDTEDGFGVCIPISMR
jgi:hypothetical protein